MRDRILTPFIPILCGVETTALGVESPGLPGRALEGQLVENGRYLIQRKTGHTRTTIRFAAHDLLGGVDVDLHVHPDAEAPEGYRLGRTGIAGTRDLPNLCGYSFKDQTGPAPLLPKERAAGFFSRSWSKLRSLLRS